jgi:hypothetical protein
LSDPILGRVTIDALAPITPTPGTPQALSPTNFFVSAVRLQSDARNSGGAILVKGPSGNVMAVLAPGSLVAFRGGGALPFINLAALFVDATATEQSCLIAYQV